MFLELGKYPLHLNVDIVDLTVEFVNAQCDVKHDENQQHCDQNEVLDQEPSPLVHFIAMPHNFCRVKHRNADVNERDDSLRHAQFATDNL